MGGEHNYLLVEKRMFSTYVWGGQAATLYTFNSVYLVSQINSLKVLVTKASSLSDQLAEWFIVLPEYDTRYTLVKAIKGQALPDFLAKHPIPKDSPLNDELPDEPSFTVD